MCRSIKLFCILFNVIASSSSPRVFNANRNLTIRDFVSIAGIQLNLGTYNDIERKVSMHIP